MAGAELAEALTVRPVGDGWELGKGLVEVGVRCGGRCCRTQQNTHQHSQAEE